MPHLSRRAFMRTAALTLGGAALAPLEGLARGEAGWAQAAAIVARIKVPTFPNREFNITRYGARAADVGDSTAAIRSAIDACARAGGGRVRVPAGRFLTGPLHLLSGVNLHLDAGSTLAFVQDPRAYLPHVLTRFEGVELMNYSPFIYAYGKSNIAVTGQGTLDGQASADVWWPWKGGGSGPNQTAARARLLEMAAKGVPPRERVFGEGGYMRPNFVQPYKCRNVLIEGITIVNSPMWEIHPVLSSNVTVRGVTVSSHGPNNDGCNPESSRDVLIERCTFDTGDDCIALKSGRNDDGRRLHTPVQDVVIRDCVMKDGHGGVVIGSEVSGGARRIFAERCRMDSPRLDRVLRFKTNSVRGGVIEQVYMRDITVGQVAEAIVVADFFYEEGDSGRFPPTLRDVDVRRVTSRQSRYGLLLRGYPHAPITRLRVEDCTFDGVREGDRIEAVRSLEIINVRVNGILRNERVTK
ncbi:MAG: glycoside hydrolase family 28 protein [Acidobacteriota bacterium]